MTWKPKIKTRLLKSYRDINKNKFRIKFLKATIEHINQLNNQIKTEN